ncbi:MAG TPA: molybdopterin-dependent oxidoreductase [Gemmatimonadaceae bacterium]|nr:molybdopterin-dependent oxidoreductase [Gemmatimonadaceae bacterium]
MSDTTQPTGVRRREFLKILGVTGAGAATVGCGPSEAGRLIPYLVSPDQTVPGVSTYFATTCRECAAGCGVIAETRDGRAIKLEGNPEHPINRGAICARGQAALQGLYNPDRFTGPRVKRNGQWADIPWQEAIQLFRQRLDEARASGRAADVLFLNRHETGSFPAFLDQWLAGMGLGPHLAVDPTLDHAVIAANREAYGVAWPSLSFTDARLVVSIGADFLDGWGASVAHQLDFADARAKLQGAPRFVYLGARRSLTGLNADTWIPVRSGSELTVANALLSAVRGGGRGDMAEAARAADVPVEALERLGAELASARPSLVLSGVSTVQARDVARAVNAINQAAGNVGRTVRPESPVASFDGAASMAELSAAVERMRGGSVPLLMLRGVNPMFTMPKSGQIAEALARVPFKVAFTSFPDETAELCDLVLPDHHALESWGDAQVLPNVVSLQQPAMDPVFRTRATADVLLEVAAGTTPQPGRPADYRSWLISRFPGGATAFASALQTGITTGSTARVAPRAPRTDAPSVPAPVEGDGDLTFIVYPSAALGADGANKPWLQELPDPVSKICWQSWIEIHPETAARLDVQPGDLLEVQGSGGTVRAPAYLYPGIRRDTVAMAFGRGHTAYGRFAKDVGANPLDALSLGFDRAGMAAWSGSRVRVRKAGEYVQLVTTEGSARQHGRGIGRALAVNELGGGGAASGEEHAADVAPQGAGEGGQAAAVGQPAEAEHGGGHVLPGDASHEPLPGLRAPIAADAEGDLIDPKKNEVGMYDPAHPTGMAKRRWAMTIDLARCTGCSACVTACYAENNIPTVGAAYQSGHTQGLPKTAGANILRSREMAWIRLERYWEGDEASADFDVRFVPMLCQHCGNAPCEPVCPVFATYHSPDGLNVQVYNRCVGTRYCSNNCPYKVRYFNWFGYGETNRPQYAWPEPLNWQLNPDVTVRGKGVMEKCTFCVQRIREAENRARAEGREVAPDEFTVACAQACPSRAIVFGDAADEQWTVARQVRDERAYHVFEELNTFTAVVYLKKVTHPASEVAAPAAAGGE